MFYYEVAPTVIIRKANWFFTYHYHEALTVGQVVSINIGNRQTIGVILKKTTKPAYKTKPLSDIALNIIIPTHSLKLAHWISDYYFCHYSQALSLFLPKNPFKKRQKKYTQQVLGTRKRTKIVLNNNQRSALEAVTNAPSGTFLLHGVTGSGKTEVYIRLAKQTLQNNRSVIVLTPEISLTPQIFADFAHHFNNIIINHSEMTEADRFLAWKEAQTDIPHIVIGPRSALFLPLKNIGLIIIDESHEPSYKQEKNPKYSAIRVATMLGRYHNATVLLGSATPDATDYYLAQKTEHLIEMLTPARKNTTTPTTKIVDLKDRANFKQHYFLSDILLQQITENLENNRQTLIFHNRRGSASIALCGQCGWTSLCPNCFIPLRLHADRDLLLCHICGHKQKILPSCPNCHNSNITYRGIGTKTIEQEIKKIFPEAIIRRFDSDNKLTEKLVNNYDELYSGKINIIIGTQTIAKGLDLPKLQTVGIIQADVNLTLPDFNSDERIFQLITQATGRVGRDNKQSSVILQTYQPDDPVIFYSLTRNYKKFYNYLIKKRQKNLLPPFSYLLKLTCSYKNENSTIKATVGFKNLLVEKFKNDKQVVILNPTPAFHERQDWRFYWHILIKSTRRDRLLRILEEVPDNHWQTDIDPVSLL